MGEAIRSVPVLELSNISKHFGAIQAVNDVSLSLEPGEVVGLMGDNGAGKSTLVKMIAGNFLPSTGTMKMEGREIVLHKPLDARRHGIEIVHQDLALCNNLTAAANVFLGRELHRSFGPLRLLDYAGMYRRAGELFADLKSETRPRDVIKQMSGGQRQAVALLMATMAPSKILLLDEHTAALDPRTAEFVLGLTTRLVRELGLTTLMVTHSMHQALALGDRLLMLHEGRIGLDLAGEAKARLTVEDLLAEFRRTRGVEIDEDALLLG